MAETIEISDGVVHLVDRTVIKSMPLSAFKEALFRDCDFVSPLLLPATVLHGRRGGKAVYVVEQAPALRTIRYRDSRRNGPGGVREYAIPVPWCYFTLGFRGRALENFVIHFADGRVRSVQDLLCHACLPNVYRDGSVCLGDMRFDVTSSDHSRTGAALTGFWESIFNTDVAGNFPDALPQAIKARSPGDDYLAGWAGLTMDEACALHWQAYRSLGDVVEDELKGG